MYIQYMPTLHVLRPYMLPNEHAVSINKLLLLVLLSLLKLVKGSKSGTLFKTAGNGGGGGWGVLPNLRMQIAYESILG